MILLYFLCIALAGTLRGKKKPVNRLAFFIKVLLIPQA